MKRLACVTPEILQFKIGFLWTCTTVPASGLVEMCATSPGTTRTESSRGRFALKTKLFGSVSMGSLNKSVRSWPGRPWHCLRTASTDSWRLDRQIEVKAGIQNFSRRGLFVHSGYGITHNGDFKVSPSETDLWMAWAQESLYLVQVQAWSELEKKPLLVMELQGRAQPDSMLTRLRKEQNSRASVHCHDKGAC